MKSNKNKELSDYEIQCSIENQSSFENSVCVKKEKKIKLKLKKERIYKQKTHGPWTKEEDEKFMNYIRSNIQVFESKNLRRRNKVFRAMAKYLKTRSSEQCRSHHQKYEQRFETSQKIISHIQKKIMLTEQNNSLNLPKVCSYFSDEEENCQGENQRNNSKAMSFISKDQKEKNEKNTGIPLEKYTLLLNKDQYKIFQKKEDNIFQIRIEINLDLFFH